MDETEEIYYRKHAKYFLRFINLMPPSLSSHDCSRMTIAFFAICGLDILDSLSELGKSNIEHVKNWIYHLQVIPEGKLENYGGFQGSSTLKCIRESKNAKAAYKSGHLAMTYTAIAVLVTLGDDLSRLNRKAIIEGVSANQQEDGSFSASLGGNEHDMRFVYCAAAICYMLDDWGSVDKRKMANYILQSIRYDYGISQHLQMESHGGTTFCAIAALDLSGQLDILPASTIEKIKRYTLFRQIQGFQGRPNKPVDTCYSFWIAATLKILNAFELTDYNANKKYILTTQDTTVGGFSKWPTSHTDAFHSYFGLCGLSFIGDTGLKEIMPSLNISLEAFHKLKTLQNKWKTK